MATFGGLDGITGFNPLSEEKEEAEDDNIQNDDYNPNNNNNKSTTLEVEPNESLRKMLMKVAHENIESLFRDQFNEGFANIYVKDHYEIIALKSSRFKLLLSKIYYDKFPDRITTSGDISYVLDILQSKAEFGETQHHLSLRVAECDGDLYYDLTNEKHQSVRVSKEGYWEKIDITPIPLFKRYNQTPQDFPMLENSQLDDDDDDPLDFFISNYTNIKDNETKLVVKVAIISWFIPNIPHPVFIVHGGKGSAKSTFLTLIKHLVDPAKPTLLTVHDDKAEFIQQVAHNYLSAYDNLKHIPKWLSDEACKAITGNGHSKRVLYTDDEDKIFEYKHCLVFNGINVVFSEPDVIDRSIIIELSEIREDDRRTEKEVLDGFYKTRPKILKYVFDILAKAITTKNDIKIKRLPRMADFAEWGVAISQAMGYRHNEFLKAYYNNIKYQNTEVIDSNPVAFAIKKFVESIESTTANYGGDGHGCYTYDINSNKKTYFEGTPAELLKRLDQIAKDNKIDEHSPEWPKDQRWLVRRINQVISNLQQDLGISICIKRDSNNTSIIKIDKTVPHDEKLSPYLDEMSPEHDGLSPNNNKDLSTKSTNFGVIGDNGDISPIPIDNSDNISANPMVGYREPFYYCKQHSNVQNTHPEEINHHIQYSKEHQQQPST